ncbi:MAG TPA: DUF305 domain-containing protein [Propionibacteriaceae bacterium]|jgi:uncharacterized protein (DUF305 family)
MTKQHAVKATLTALAVGLTLGLAGCGGSNDAGGMGGMDHNASPMSQMPTANPSSSDPSPAASAAAQFNDADVMFVQGMIPHHQQAVEMSDTLLKKSGITADTTALAKQIKAAQQPEITTMESWLKTWGKTADGGMGGMTHGGMGDGMATDDQLKAFEQADGPAAEKLYLEMMTKHHQGAIMMAQAELTNGESPDAIQLAKDITSSQQAEIATMKNLLAAL